MLFAAFIKNYGIVGLAFFFFSKRPDHFIFWCLVWGVVFFIAPMLITKPSFIVQSYFDWAHALMVKDARNVRMDIHNDFQDISVPGMIRRIFNYQELNAFWVAAIAFGIFLLQYCKVKYFKNTRYQLYILCSTLLFTVLFSSSSESPTYIIAFPAVCIWFVMQRPSKWVNAVFIFALILTSFSYSDLLTYWFREHLVRPYSLKALPCFVVWIIISVQIFKNQFLNTSTTNFMQKHIPLTQ
jgi:hypothetical protein